MKRVLKTTLLYFQDFGVAKLPKNFWLVWNMKHQQKSNKKGSKFKQQKSCQEKKTTNNNLPSLPSSSVSRPPRWAKSQARFFWRFLWRFTRWRWEFFSPALSNRGSNLEPSKKKTPCKHVKSWSAASSHNPPFQPSASHSRSQETIHWGAIDIWGR